MKRKLFLIPALLLGLAVVVNFSCSEEADPTDTCIDTANPCNAAETYKTCANSTGDGSGYFVYNGETYSFTAANLETVAAQLVEDMCPTKSITDTDTRDFIVARGLEVIAE